MTALVFLSIIGKVRISLGNRLVSAFSKNLSISIKSKGVAIADNDVCWNWSAEVQMFCLLGCFPLQSWVAAYTGIANLPSFKVQGQNVRNTFLFWSLSDKQDFSWSGQGLTELNNCMAKLLAPQLEFKVSNSNHDLLFISYRNLTFNMSTW